LLLLLCSWMLVIGRTPRRRRRRRSRRRGGGKRRSVTGSPQSVVFSRGRGRGLLAFWSRVEKVVLCYLLRLAVVCAGRPVGVASGLTEKKT
jgi:hypothetical protein